MPNSHLHHRKARSVAAPRSNSSIVTSSHKRLRSFVLDESVAQYEGSGRAGEYDLGFWYDVVAGVLLPMLELVDIHKFSTCSRQTRQVVTDYLAIHNPFDLMVRPFFASDLAGPFRSVLSDNHAVVSGSCALAYFMMESFPNADMDVYAHFRLSYPIGLWLIANGYEFMPRRHQLFSWQAFASYQSTND
ncbi:hypothetical protein BDZ89DRAFT_1142138 [Hymenopellis radicata]|nr:hypothetical protein BDZ89DRAFT_1142138 [Hymenopellis radicata]